MDQVPYLQFIGLIFTEVFIIHYMHSYVSTNQIIILIIVGTQGLLAITL